MTNEFVKKLTGKNPKDFEFAAEHIINNCDVQAFSALVEQSDFLFDFIKKNVEKRLSAAINETNYKNLFKFLKIYSPDYEEVIVSTFVKFADEDLTDEMLGLFENGTDEEKTYCAKYFSRINDTLALDLLKKYSYSEFDALSLNCAEALSEMKDEESYNLAIEKIKSQDEFEKLSAVRFLTAYKDQRAIQTLLETMKKSSMPENIASEISYLQSFLELLETEHKDNAILAINYIISGLGEIISLSQLFDFQLFEVIEKLFQLQDKEHNSKIALVLLNAKQKFEQLTENNEYIFDEDKTIKEEVFEIKNLLNSQDETFWAQETKLFQDELLENSEFVFSALELVLELNLADSFDKLKALLGSSNQTIILKTVEVIKALNKLPEIRMDEVLTRITDENIRLIIQSNFKI